MATGIIREILIKLTVEILVICIIYNLTIVRKMSLTAEFNEESIKELIERKPPNPIKLRRYNILV